MIKKCFLFFLYLLFLLPHSVCAQNKVLNIYAWTGEIPDFVVRQFEKETGIRINIATYENNEIMYAKLRAEKNAGYDLVMPSSYFVDRMSKQHLLEQLDKSKLPGWNNLNPAFTHPTYDPNTDYSLPYIWGITGIFVNTNYYSEHDVQQWTDLWNKKFYNQLLLLDDTREVFSMALLSLGYSANDQNKDHIKAAFLKLKSLMPNVKVFSSDTVVSLIIDEDATVGMAWNGDTFKAYKENPNAHFIFPKDGFVIWVDNFSIPRGAKHKEAAYQFLNFILRPEIAKNIALATDFPTTNLAAQKLLPLHIQNNPIAYPSADILRRGQFQTDVSDQTLSLFEKYWEELKMSG